MFYCHCGPEVMKERPYICGCDGLLQRRSRLTEGITRNEPDVELMLHKVTD